MSRPRKYWFHMVRSMVCRYGLIKKGDSEQEKRFAAAIEKCLGEIASLPGGEDRVKAVEMVLIKRTHTQEGAAMALHYSSTTIKRWTVDFVYRVGNNVGFSKL